MLVFLLIRTKLVIDGNQENKLINRAMDKCIDKQIDRHLPKKSPLKDKQVNYKIRIRRYV